jgi:hypothetical protein
MTLSPAGLALLIALPWSFGAALLLALGVRPRADRLAFAGHSWFAGALALAVLLHGWLLLGLPLARAPFVATAVAMAALLAALGARRGVAAEAAAPTAPAAARARIPWLALAVVAALALTADRIVHANAVAVVMEDEAEIWAGKAKALFVAGGFGARLGPLAADLSHADYPPLDPLLQLWTYVLAGRIVHVENRLPLQWGTIGATLLLASALRRRASPAVAAGLLLLWSAAPETGETVRFANADGLVAFALLGAADAWLRFTEGGGAGWWRVAAVELGALVWAKNEGDLLLVAALAAGGVALARDAALRRRVRSLGRQLLWLALPLLLVAVHVAINRRFGWRNDLMQPAGDVPPLWRGIVRRLDFASMARIATAFARELFFREDPTGRLVAGQACLVAAFLGPALLGARAVRRGGAAAVTLALLFGLAGLFCVYAATPNDLEWQLRLSAHRVLYDLVPTAVLALGVVFGAREPAT